MKTLLDMEYLRTSGKDHIQKRVVVCKRVDWSRDAAYASNIDSYYDRFHVDDLSSAHVYLRLKKDQRLEDVSDKTVMECAQLVKANSIEGCKLKEVHVVYTRWFVVFYMLGAFV